MKASDLPSVSKESQQVICVLGGGTRWCRWTMYESQQRNKWLTWISSQSTYSLWVCITARPTVSFPKIKDLMNNATSQRTNPELRWCMIMVVVVVVSVNSRCECPEMRRCPKLNLLYFSRDFAAPHFAMFFRFSNCDYSLNSWRISLKFELCTYLYIFSMSNT